MCSPFSIWIHNPIILEPCNDYYINFVHNTNYINYISISGDNHYFGCRIKGDEEIPPPGIPCKTNCDCIKNNELKCNDCEQILLTTLQISQLKCITRIGGSEAILHYFTIHNITAEIYP